VKHAAATTPLLALCLLAILCGSARSQEAPSSPVPLKGPTMGAVGFPHSAHTRVAGKCELCHHPSNPDKPLKAPQEACTDCHTKPPTPPVTVGLETAFHNSTATAGLCINCHKTENSHGKAAPVQCADCHMKKSS
jgi:hypothetical protein